ncbi:MAG TPA: response regulator [Polyangiaceae bacterium]|jgi:DNA-binding response OmpR family regulator
MTETNKRERVLVVDDNVDGAELTKEYLAMLGYDVAVAHDGGAALDVSAAFTPTIALLDIGLPVVDGYEVARRLRTRYGRAIRLIAVSGYGQERDRALAREAGFDTYLVKPVDLDGLVARLSSP